MTVGKRRQLVVLGGAAIAIIVALVLTRGETPAGAPARASNPVRPRPGAAAVPSVADVHLELLKMERDELEPPERNPFRFQPKAPPAPPPSPTPVGPPLAPVAVAPPMPVGPPPPPPIALKFIGVVDAPGGAGKVALLSDARGGVFQGREGEVVEGRYKILRIGTESIEVSYIDGRGRQTIRLSGQ